MDSEDVAAVNFFWMIGVVLTLAVIFTNISKWVESVYKVRAASLIQVTPLTADGELSDTSYIYDGPFVIKEYDLDVVAPGVVDEQRVLMIPKGTRVRIEPVRPDGLRDAEEEPEAEDQSS